jgi:predicted HicB family RNase H-like nuclease
MSNDTQKRRGAPKKSVTKTRVQICLDPQIHDLAKKYAFADGMALSAWIEKLARTQLEAAQ